MPKLLKEMMSSYLTTLDDSDYRYTGQPSFLRSRSQKTSELPVVPSASTWEVVTDPRRFHRKFEFESYSDYSNFVSELMKYESQAGHHGKLVCEYPSIVIEVYTHDVEGITESDQNYIRIVDQIFEDIQFFGQDEEVYEY